MNSRKNRGWIVLMAMLLVISLLTGCAGGNGQKSESVQQAKDKLLEEWFALLEAHEQVYSSAFQVLEYMEAFSHDNSWDTLLRARASGSAAVVAIRQMELPALELTEEEIDLLSDAGVEINAVQREFEELKSMRSIKDDSLSLFCYTLEDDVFLRASAEDAIPAMTAFYREYFTLEYRYLTNFTNYLLLQMDCPEVWSLWQEQLPCMAACADIWYEDTDAVEAAAGKLLDEMAEAQTRMGSFLGISEFTLEIVQDAVDTGNLEALQREINVISGVPGYFPVPEWLPDVLNLYLVTDGETQEKQLVHAAMPLESVPSSCYISCGEISAEEVEAYGERLKQWGIEVYGTWNEAKDTYQLLVNSGSSTMMVEWTEQETLLYLTEPVGCLIPELYLYAMTAE